MANESTKSAKVNGQLSVEEVSEKFNGGRKIIDFTGHSKIFFGISIAIIVIGIICNFIFGTTLDIQFSGGASVKYSYSTDISESELTDFIQSHTEARITTSYSTDMVGNSGHNVAVQFSGNKAIDTNIQSTLLEDLNKQYPDAGFKILESGSIDASMGFNFLLKCLTAVAIAKALGILENEDEAITGSELEEMSDEDLTKNIRKYSVYARVSPEHKVRIVKAWQANGEIVAMTGDGVNDAPALKNADIGVAMGMVGTDFAKEASDVILTDDNFATVVSAVEEGRRIYDNILKAIQYLLSSNVGEIIVLFVAILITPWLSSKFGIDVSLIVPLLPIHILWINLVTDSLPALALAVDPAEEDIMERKPLKSGKGIFTKGMTWRVIYQGVMIGLLTLAAFIIGLATPEAELPQIEGLSVQEIKVEIGQTMAFCVLAFSQLVHVFNVRDNKTSIFKTGIFSNKQLILAVLASAALMLGILLIPALRHVFSIPVLPVGNILEIVVLSLMPLIVVELFKLIKINTSKSEKL